MEKYKHYRNNKTYILEDYCKIQEFGKWVLAVLYYEESDKGKNLYCRSMSEFEVKFKRVVN